MDVFLLDLRRRAAIGAFGVENLMQIAAGGERLALGGNHQHAGVLPGLHASQHVEALFEGVWLEAADGKRVSGVVPSQHQVANAVVYGKFHMLVSHGRF